MAKLLRERNVARFMVAPAGFGKSTLALEYAETVFAFDHVFWVDCASPCFLRDLDARSIVRGLVEVDGEPFLAVFEDVPPLDSLRAELFGAVLDDLLERGCEVLITCTPAADVFADQIDRMLIGAGDLLLSDEERERIIEALQQTKYNKSKAAQLLGVDRKTLYNKIKQYGL